MKNFKTRLISGLMFMLLPAIALASPSGDLQRILKPATASFKTGGTFEFLSGSTLLMDSGATLNLSGQSLATISATTLQAGSDAVAGIIKAYPATTAKGFMEILPINAGGAFNTLISNSATLGQSTTYTLPDPGASTADIVVNKADQSIAGVKSFTGTLGAGISGTAGTINVFPGTAANGKIIISAINNSGNFNSTLTNKNIGQSTVYSLPECSAATCDLLSTTGAQTVTGVKTFTTPVLGAATATSLATSAASPLLLTNGQLATIALTSQTVGATTLTIPDFAGVSDSFSFITLAQTLVNKTMTAPVLNNPVISGPAPVACGSTCTLGASAKGTYVRMDTAGGSAVTLPNATGTGTVYRIYISVANSSNQDKVLLNTVTDTIIGTAIGENAGTAKVFVGNAGTYHSIQMPFAGTQPSGGFVGDTITCTDVASTVYKCDIMYQAGTTPTTPYSTGTT